jgi:sugar/nucleoside kinase (ribokinase family)
LTALYDVVALGDCDVDIFVGVRQLPTWDEKVPGDLLAIEGGGVAANFSCATASLGLNTALVSSVGDDEFGSIALKSLKGYGVDVNSVAVRQNASTYFSVVCLDERGEKALTIVRTPTFFPSWDEIVAGPLRDTRLLHIAPFDLSLAARAAQLAQASDVAVSVDLEPAMVRQSIDEATPLLASSDILFVNEFTVARFFTAGEFTEPAGALYGMGPEIVVVTKGAEGCYVRVADRELRASSYQVEPKDTTGAGDAFNAGFLAWWLDGHQLEECITAGTAAAAMAISKVGARSGLPTRDQIDRFIREHGRLVIDSFPLPNGVRQ